MARIEDDRWIIETEEEAEAIAKLLNEPPKVNEKLQAALDKYKSLGFGEAFDRFDLFEQDLKQPEVQIKHNGNEVTVQDIENSFTSPRLEKAIKKLQDMSHEECKEFLSKHKSIPIDANAKPWKYATHCLKADETSIFICNDIQQLLYIDGSWQPSSVYHGILKEIETEYHDWLDPEHKQYNTVSRKDVESYQRILDEQGFPALDAIHTDLGNSSFIGTIPSLNAIAVVMYNNNLMNFGPQIDE